MNTSHITLRPNRLTITPRRKPLTMSKSLDLKIASKTKSDIKKQYEVNFAKRPNAFKMSKATKRKIFDSINMLYTLSKPKHITMANGGQIFNFRANFITLTLPSKQLHSDKEIKEKCLNQFLVELRKNYGLNNYLWKAELQGNANVHFHLITDKYMDFQALRRRWNRCINKLGYVDQYRSKMSRLSFKEYCKLRGYKRGDDIAPLHQAFKKGQANNWSNPNSVDVRSVHGKRELAIYIAKYISKESHEIEPTDQDLDRGAAFGRLYARSQSLCLPIGKGSICPEEWKDLLYFLNNCTDKVKYIWDQFYTVYYFAIDELPTNICVSVYRYFYGNARFWGYVFS